MQLNHRRVTALVLLLSVPLMAAPGDNWPQFRGPAAAGVVEADIPLNWNVDNGTNVVWKTPIPGLGLSSPVIWGDKVFVTTAIRESGEASLKVGLYGNIQPVMEDESHSWRLVCLDKATGKLLWEKESNQGVPKVKRHTKASHANCTPAANDSRVVAFFGSEGLHCYDHAGNHKWSRDFGVLDAGYYVVPTAQWEFASSPIIHDDKVIVQCDIQEGSFLEALSLETGKTIWRTERNEVPTWSTPAVVTIGGREQVVCNGYKHIGGYDLATGKELWKMAGGGDIPVPTPIVADEKVFITNAHGDAAPLYAIDPAATGDITPESVGAKGDYLPWTVNPFGNYMQTPIVVGKTLYGARDNGIVMAVPLSRGRVVSRLRLGGGSSGFTASPVSDGKHLFFSSEDGDVYVVSADLSPRVLATNSLGEIIMATPAISDDSLFIRGRRHLFRIGKK